MKTTLIYPGITQWGFDSFGKVKDPEANFVYYGLAYISSYAKINGHSIDLIDLRKLSGWDVFKVEVEKRSPGVFGISSMSCDYGMALRCIEIIKHIDKSSIVIIGGVHATVALEEVAANPNIDYIITGEGEISFSKLLSDIESEKTPDRIIKGASSNIEELPFPDRELFDFESGELKTPWLPHMPSPFSALIIGRGCPFYCSFCQPAERMIFDGKVKIRSIENVMEELSYLEKRYNIKSFLIHDDLFIIHPKYVDEFCKEYKRKGFNQTFACQARADIIEKNEEIIKKLADVGLSCLMIGFESGSQRILDFLKKGTTIEQNRNAVKICRKYGIKIFANFMFGIPTETTEEVIEIANFVREMKPKYFSPAYFTPYPKTELYEYCKANNLVLEGKPHENYRRSPQEPKIKGVDYDFLQSVIQYAGLYDVDVNDEKLAEKHYSNACMLLKLGDFDRALDELKKVSFFKEDYIKAHYLRGSIYKTLGRLEEACKEFNRVIIGSISKRVNTTLYKSEYEAGAHFHLGSIFLSKREYHQALKEFKKCLLLNPQHQKAKDCFNFLSCITRKKHSYKKHKNILLTGATGYIGSELVKRLLEENFDIAILTRHLNFEGFRNLMECGCKIYEGSIENRKDLQQIKNIDTIIHLAACLHLDGDRKSIWSINVEGTRNLLDIAVSLGAEKFICASSIEATGPVEKEAIPADEEYPCKPCFFYGETKLEAEKLVMKYREEYDLKTYIMRIGNVYGGKKDNFILPIVNSIRKRDEFFLNLGSYKDRFLHFIHINDVVEAFIRLITLSQVKEELFFLVGDEPITIGDLCKLICFLIGEREQIINDACNKEPTKEEIEKLINVNGLVKYIMGGIGNRIYRVYSNKKLKKELITPQVDLKEGIGKTIIDFYKRGII